MIYQVITNTDNKKKQRFIEKLPLSLIDQYDNVLVIRDEELGKTIDVVIRGGLLYCDLHGRESDTSGEKYDCLHIEYALTLPQIDKLKKSGRLL